MTWRLSAAFAIFTTSVVASCRGDSISAVVLFAGAMLLTVAETLLRLRGQRLTRTRLGRWEVTCGHCNYGQMSYHSAKRLRTALRTMWRHHRLMHPAGTR